MVDRFADGPERGTELGPRAPERGSRRRARSRPPDRSPARPRRPARASSSALQPARPAVVPLGQLGVAAGARQRRRVAEQRGHVLEVQQRGRGTPDCAPAAGPRGRARRPGERRRPAPTAAPCRSWPSPMRALELASSCAAPARRPRAGAVVVEPRAELAPVALRSWRARGVQLAQRAMLGGQQPESVSSASRRLARAAAPRASRAAPPARR